MPRNLLLKYLNEQLTIEMESQLEFTLQSCAPADPRIQKRLMEFAHEEAEHIRMLMTLIVGAGGQVAPAAPRVLPAESLDSFLRRGTNREDDSIARLSAVVELLDDPADRAAIQEAIDQEKKHRALLDEIMEYCREARLS